MSYEHKRLDHHLVDNIKTMTMINTIIITTKKKEEKRNSAQFLMLSFLLDRIIDCVYVLF